MSLYSWQTWWESAQQDIGLRPYLQPPTSMVSAPATTTLATITMATNQSTALTECTLALLSTRLGQQGKERARSKCHNEELSQQLTASLEMAEMAKKGMQVGLTAKTNPFKSTTLIQTDKRFHNGKEGCNNYQHRCPFPHCKHTHICYSCKQEHHASQCSSGGTVTVTSQ